MENIRAIQCFSTGPYFAGRGLSGRRCEPDNFEMPDYLLHTLVLSALQWRRVYPNCPLVLFTDSVFYHYLDIRGLLDCWDCVKVDLDELNSLPIRQSVFWAACKFFAYSRVQAPFVCIDTDFVVLKPLEIPEGDLVVAHYEDINTSSYGYYQNADGELGVNMCFSLFRNETFKSQFVEEAYSTMFHCVEEYDGSYAMPNLLCMEQIRPVEIAKRERFQIGSLLEACWSPEKRCFTENDKRYGYWVFFRLRQQPVPFAHLWFHKNYLEENVEAKVEYLGEVNTLLETCSPEIYKTLCEHNTK